jgi:hypothetical protein
MFSSVVRRLIDHRGVRFAKEIDEFGDRVLFDPIKMVGGVMETPQI